MNVGLCAGGRDLIKNYGWWRVLMVYLITSNLSGSLWSLLSKKDACYGRKSRDTILTRVPWCSSLWTWLCPSLWSWSWFSSVSSAFQSLTERGSSNHRGRAQRKYRRGGMRWAGVELRRQPRWYKSFLLYHLCTVWERYQETLVVVCVPL